MRGTTLLCDQHQKAPPGQRGGWISAHRRLLKLAESDDAPLNASLVYDRLWVGGKPPFDRPLKGFSMLVLCAREVQPVQVAFQGKVIRPAIDDAHLSKNEARRVLYASTKVAGELAAGGRVLSTCYMGWNRSALVAGLALLRLTRMKPGDVVVLVRRARGEDALSNPHFVEMLERFYELKRRR
mgnify:CR=1 FL=1